MYAYSAATPFLAVGIASLLLIPATDPISPTVLPVGLAALGIGFLILHCRSQQPLARPALSAELRVAAAVMCGILYAVLLFS